MYNYARWLHHASNTCRCYSETKIVRTFSFLCMSCNSIIHLEFKRLHKCCSVSLITINVISYNNFATPKLILYFIIEGREYRPCMHCLFSYIIYIYEKSFSYTFLFCFKALVMLESLVIIVCIELCIKKHRSMMMKNVYID